MTRGAILQIARQRPRPVKFNQMTFTNDQLTTIQAFPAATLYEACLLFVHTDPLRLETAASQLEQSQGQRRWPVGRELSAFLLNLPAPDRGPATAEWFRAAVDARHPDPVLVTDIALLFEPVLQFWKSLAAELMSTDQIKAKLMNTGVILTLVTLWNMESWEKVHGVMNMTNSLRM